MSQPRIAEAGSAVTWKAVQSLTSEAIALLRLLILARLVLPEDFGLLSIAQVTLGTLIAITDFGMMPALIQRRRISEEHYHAAWTVVVLRGTAITAVVIAVAPWIALLFAEPRATPVIRLLALRAVLDAAASIKVAELTRELKFRALALIRLPAVVVETAVAISLAQRWGVWALVAGILAGGATSVVMSHVMAPYRPRWSADFAAARPLIRYGRWIFANNLVAVAGSAVLQVVIARQLGAASLGLYYLAIKLAFQPSQLASEVIGSVAFPLYARLQADIRRAARAFEAVVIGMAAALSPVYVLLIALAPPLVEQVLGERWGGSAPVLRILALAGLLGLFGDAVVPLLRGLGKPDRVVALEALQSTLMIGLVGWLAGRYGLAGAAFAWLPAVGASQVLALFFVRQTFGHRLWRLRRAALAILGCSGLGALLAVAAAGLLPGPGGLAVAAGGGAAVIVLALWGCDRWLALGLAADLARVFPRFATFLGFATVPELDPGGRLDEEAD